VRAYIAYSEVFDTQPTWQQIIGVVKELQMVDAVLVLSRMNLAVRFALQEHNRPNFGRLQQVLIGNFTDDEIFKRLQERFPHVSTEERPIFVPISILNVLRLVLAHSRPGTEPNLADDPKLQFAIGRSCLMMNDLLLSTEEKREIKEGTKESRRLALLVQILAPFELANPPAAHHLLFRFNVLYRTILNDPAVRARISQECNGFEFEQEFRSLTGIPLERWLSIVFSMYAYFLHGGNVFDPHPDYRQIDPSAFRGDSGIAEAELRTVLATTSAAITDVCAAVTAEAPTDPRFDFVPFRSKPLVSVVENRFVPIDIAFMLEKLHTGVQWAMHDALSRERREQLFQAWGILFEEYVHWLLGGMETKLAITYIPTPQWKEGGESFDGVLLRDSVFMPIECKGGFLSRAARYSGAKEEFFGEMEEKFVPGCRQLARKTKALFTADSVERKHLSSVTLDSIRAVVPVLAVQDQILRAPGLNWYLNMKFQGEMRGFQARPDIVVRPLTVVNVNELETMVNSAEAVGFDFIYALHHRTIRDEEVLSNLQEWLMQFPDYGRSQSPRTKRIYDESHDPLFSYLFPRETDQ